MHLSVDWPSLADELGLSDALFGRRGYALVASWLDGELSRVDDMEFARSFSNHIDLPGVHAEDYLHRRIRTSSGTLLGGIRFYGRNISRPFVEIIAHSFDDLDRLCDCVSREWSMFAPPVVRLRARPGRLTGANIVLDESIYAARYSDMRPPASHVWLDPFDRVEDAAAIVNTGYQQLADTPPSPKLRGRRTLPAISASCSSASSIGSTPRRGEPPKLPAAEESSIRSSFRCVTSALRRGGGDRARRRTR